MRKFATGCALAALTLAASPQAWAQPGEVKLGALIPLTGGLQAYGESSLNGMRLAIEQVNEAGGVHGQQVELLVGDTQTKSQAAIDAAKRLVSVDGVSGILGALSSGNTIPVATSVTAVEGVPQISNASTAPAITDLDDNDFLFRTVPSDASQGQVLGRLVAEQGLGNVAVIYVNNDYGQGLYEAFEQGFTEAGGTVSGAAAYEPNKASYRGELESLQESEPEALVVIAYPDDGGLLIVRQSLEEQLFESFVFTDGMKTTQLLDQIGAEFMNGTYGTAPKAAESEAGELFAQAYQDKYGELPPLPFIDAGYDAAMLMALALQAAPEGADGASVRDALREVAGPPGVKIMPGQFEQAKTLLDEGQDIDYEGAAGAQDFDAQGDVAGTIEHWAVQDGELVTVDLLSSGES